MTAAPPYHDTLRALLAPRRLVPVVMMALPLVIAQASLSDDPMALPIGTLMCASFWLVGPHAWRTLLPFGARERGVSIPLGLGLYVTCALIVVGLVGWVLPHAIGMGGTLLTDESSLLVAAALFTVGGFGLGRDIDLERGLAEERRRVEALAREAEHAQLLALRSHLDPHFLFNTLNAIAEWCREDGEVAERATLELSRMLRTVLAGVKVASWPLADELALVDTLFSLHLFRDPALFEVVRELPAELPDVEVPPMILLPVAENAVKHGPASGHRGRMVVRVRAEGAELRLAIENPGPFRGPRDGGEGLGIVRRRLSLAYGGDATFAIAARGDQTVAEIVIPLERRAPEVTA